MIIPKKHLSDWFPYLPSYVGFVQRLNKVSHLFELLFGQVQNELIWDRKDLGEVVLIDSTPVILARQGRRFKEDINEVSFGTGIKMRHARPFFGTKNGRA